MTNLNSPIRLSRAGAWRTYTGGSLIEALHGNIGAADTNFPEEWILSTVRARNSGREDIVEGLSFTYDGSRSLAQIIEENPVDALGEAHVNRYGATLGVLVKLIDSAERLTVQVHPTREAAKELFNSQFGKTECWHIIGGREIDGEPPCIYFGFKEGITREYWKETFDKQDIPAMLGCLNKFYVKPGDTFLICGGVPHAIGAGCFLIEVQEPTDYTVRTERVTPQGLAVSDFMCHQGLGFDKMFDCFIYEGYTQEEIRSKYCIPKKDEEVIGYGDTEMFKLTMRELSGESVTIESCGVFSGIYVLEGEGEINGEKVCRGAQFFIPAVCKPFTVKGNMKFIRFYGPKA